MFGTSKSNFTISNTGKQAEVAKSNVSGAVITVDDVNTAVDTKPVATISQLLARLDDFKVGDRVKITVLRQGQIV